MTDAIVRTQTPEEREYTKYLADVEARKQRVAALEDDLASLRLALGRFEAEYHAALGPLFVELDRVRLAIRGYEEKIARLQADLHADAETVAQEVEDTLRAEREAINEQERENRRYEDAVHHERERPTLSLDEEAELHRLYRELAKRFHPDLARTEEERLRREPLMRRVNAAMRDRDLAAMRGLLSEAEVTDAAFEARSTGEKLVWAIREVARLDELMVALERDVTMLRSSPSYELWQRQESGEPVIERLTQNLQADLAAAQAELAARAKTYEQLIEARSGTA